MVPCYVFFRFPYLRISVFRIYEFPYLLKFPQIPFPSYAFSVLSGFLVSVLRNFRIVRISVYEFSVLVFSVSVFFRFSVLRVLSVFTAYWCMFYLVSSGLPAAAVVLLNSGLTSGPISEVLLVSLLHSPCPCPSLQGTKVLLVCPGLLPGATCLGYVLPRISVSYFVDVTLVSADGVFPL